jgi:hypothetical protein
MNKSCSLLRKFTLQHLLGNRKSIDAKRKYVYLRINSRIFPLADLDLSLVRAEQKCGFVDTYARTHTQMGWTAVHREQLFVAFNLDLDKHLQTRSSLSVYLA